MILHDSYLSQNGENIRISWDFTQYWAEIRYYDEIFRRFLVTHMSRSRLKNAFKENIPVFGDVWLTQPTARRGLPFSFYFTDKWNAVGGIHQTKHKKRKEFKLMDFLLPLVEAPWKKFRHVISVHWTCLGLRVGLAQSQTQDSHYEKTFPSVPISLPWCKFNDDMTRW